MVWQWTPYTIALMVGTVISIILALYVWLRHGHGAMSRTAASLLLAVAVWSLGYALELGYTGLSTKIFWAQVEYLGIVTVPVAWLVFALQYSGRGKFTHPPKNWLARRHAILLLAEPIVILLLVWTNEAHHLIWRRTWLDASGPFVALALSYGVGFWVHWVFSYLCISSGSVLLILTLLRSPHLYRWQAAALLVSVLAPWVGNALYVLDLNPVPNLDLTPFGFTVSAIALTWGVFRFQLFDVMPVAHRAVVDGMSDAMIVLDMRYRIVDLNPAARRIAGPLASGAIGRPAAQVLAGHANLIERYRSMTHTGPLAARVDAEIILPRPQGDALPDESEAQRYFDLHISPLHDQRGRLAGHLMVFHDTTERVQAEEQIKASLREKELLLREIHHRVKNNLQVVASLLYLQADSTKDEQIVEVLQESRNRIRSMALVHEKLYGSHDLSRIDFAAYIRSLTAHLFRSYRVREREITLKTEISDVVLGVDTAIICGLIVNELVSNALKHAFPPAPPVPGGTSPPQVGGTEGGGEIHVGLSSDQGRFTLAVGDNGAGFPPGLDFRTTESLGLQLVVMLVEQLDGIIDLDRSRGTTFRIEFAEPEYGERI